MFLMLVKHISTCPGSDSPVKRVAETREELSVLWRDRTVGNMGQLRTFDVRNVMR